MTEGDPAGHGEMVSFREMSVSEDFFQLYDQMIGDVYLPDVLQHVTEVVRRALNAERATIYLVEEQTRELVSIAVIGNVASTIRVPIREDSLAGYCASKMASFVVENAYGELSHIDPKLRFDRSWDKINNFRTRDVMCVPAVFKDQVLGVVQVINSLNGPFREADLPPLISVSRLVAYALYHARIYDELITLKRLKQEKAKFMRIMVHELKSPVATAKTMADAVQFQLKDSPKVAALVARIGKRMDDLLALVEDTLDLSRVKAGDPLGDIVEIDLVDEIRSGCEIYLEQARAKGLSMSLDLPDDEVQVRFDLKGLRLVLSNLVSNAVKYTREGSVTVALRTEDDWAVVDVTDSGIGIPEDDIPKLFSEFFRASNARASDIKGTGVGLAGVKELVERFGGRLELASKENQGSTFTARLPLYAG